MVISSLAAHFINIHSPLQFQQYNVFATGPYQIRSKSTLSSSRRENYDVYRKNILFCFGLELIFDLVIKFYNVYTHW